METAASVTANSTQTTLVLNVSGILKSVCLLPVVVIFLYFIILMLHTFCSEASFRDSTRYRLFAHMLVTDTILLTVSVTLLLFIVMKMKIPATVCYIVIIISGVNFLNTPLNLATMSLERYIAICFPLRHAELCRVERLWIAIFVNLMLAILPYVMDFYFLLNYKQITVFSQTVSCNREAVIFTSAQATLLALTYAIYFILVGTTILYTYIKIMLASRKVTTNKASVLKARKTVTLHAVQLVLCLGAFAYPLLETFLNRVHDWLRENLSYVNFYIFMLFPRFLSPLIYGLRDETFRSYMKRYMPCYSSKIAPTVGSK
ncbi:odorant receptor 131-2-like [Protopterus annectens]|uniref:odorant receptor 131-2-like n=1 Tax=Protopterus annectens TaxID=7888 RepID=UPI001CFA4315|nr:odorant receptor 131-2-like [Protopterus annectens]